MWRALAGLGGVVLLGLVSVSVPARAADEKAKVGLVETLFPGQTGEQLRKAARPFRSLLESSTGLTGEVVQGGDPLSLADKLKADKVQLGVFHGVEFAWARQRNPKLQVIALCVNKKPTLRAELIVQAASKFMDPADLRGKTLAVPDENREHCNLFLGRKCVPAGTTPEKFYKKVEKRADVEEALDDVVNGNMQAALVDGLAWDAYRKSKPGAAKRLRVLKESEPFPATALACQEGHFTAARVKQIRAGLIRAGTTRRGKQLLDQLRLTAFEAVPAQYEKQLSAILAAYPPPK